MPLACDLEETGYWAMYECSHKEIPERNTVTDYLKSKAEAGSRCLHAKP